MILKHWKRIFFTFFMPTFYGGGGGPTQTTSNVTQTTLPSWLRPQTEAMMGAATQQIFNTQHNAKTGKEDIVGIKGYNPYSSNPSDYVAGFSPLQNQSFTGAQNLTMPGNFGAATDLAGVSGIGSLGTAERASNAGTDYSAMATNPYAIQAYMSPYQQNVTDVAKQAALRDFGVAQTMRNAEASKAGAFGGSRQAIVDAEAQKNLGTQLQSIEATGLQNAFQNAQQAQQFGSNLGLQGLQAAQQGYSAANQAAGNLADIGSAQLQGQQGIIGLQNQMGSQQQQYQQDIINNAINNYAMQQQYPMQQLSMYNALLRGNATPTSATTQYQAAPSTASQLGGLGMTAIGALGQAGAFKKKGGKVKGYKSGGLVDLAIHNAIEGEFRRVS